MSKALSVDLRERVIKAIKGGMSRRQAARMPDQMPHQMAMPPAMRRPIRRPNPHIVA